MELSAQLIAPKIARLVQTIYPRDFAYVPCTVCSGTDWKVAYTGNKVIGSRLYSYGSPLPLLARGMFPLIYCECRKCGCARINPTPVDSWIDAQIPRGSLAGQVAWTESDEYVEDKQTSVRRHHERCNLARFRSHHGRVLDVSCGSGVGLEVLRDELGWSEPVGVECDPRAAACAQDKRHLDVRVGYIHDQELPLRYFDLAILDNALEHCAQPRVVLTRLRRALRRGGGLFVVVPNYHGHAVEMLGLEYHNMNWGHWHYFTVYSLKELLQDCGFRVNFAYSSVCEAEVAAKMNDRLPSDIDVELHPPELDSLGPHDKVFRGDFIHLLAVNDATRD
jgi:SAM-dependent methyltransferase